MEEIDKPGSKYGTHVARRGYKIVGFTQIIDRGKACPLIRRSLSYMVKRKQSPSLLTSVPSPSSLFGSIVFDSERLVKQFGRRPRFSLSRVARPKQGANPKVCGSAAQTETEKERETRERRREREARGTGQYFANMRGRTRRGRQTQTQRERNECTKDLTTRIDDKRHDHEDTRPPPTHTHTHTFKRRQNEIEEDEEPMDRKPRTEGRRRGLDHDRARAATTNRGSGNYDSELMKQEKRNTRKRKTEETEQGARERNADEKRGDGKGLSTMPAFSNDAGRPASAQRSLTSGG
ncbi:hypothetical protein BDN71DRAFT_1029689 [Pleurotus eryngii]|uniref:Uncharacterized protein n=1 Tax=Pleurotus eryngii TaxID=5323 RepID=A0A9P6A631_PLEER|nr:hypothetical protein BDN71DRAFT_1029689 [Pleurotus eryngii]